MFRSREGDVTGRLEYDMKCDALIRAWRKHVKFNVEDAKEKHAVFTAVQKRSKTMKMKEEHTYFDKCIDFYKVHGSQTTEWK